MPRVFHASKFYPYLMIIPALVFLLILIIYPMIFSLSLSFHTWFLGRPEVRPFVGSYNYEQILFNDHTFRVALKNTFILTGGCVSAEFLLGLLLATLLSRQNIKGKSIFRTFLFLPMVLTPIVIGVLWRFMFHPGVGIVNYLLSLVGIQGPMWTSDPKVALFSVFVIDMWQWTPFMTLILYAGIQSLPREPLEAAQVDGASERQIFRHVTLPLLKPVIILSLIFRTIDVLKTFDIVYVLTRGGPGEATEVLTLYTYRIGFNYFYMGRAAAMSFIIAIILTVLIQLYIKVLRAEFRE